MNLTERTGVSSCVSRWCLWRSHNLLGRQRQKVDRYHEKHFTEILLADSLVKKISETKPGKLKHREKYDINKLNIDLNKLHN